MITFSYAGYWCRLWLAYMHLVLVGLDLLRMDRNKPYFEGVRFQQGFMDLLRPEGNPPGKPKVTPAEVELYMYDLSDADMYGLAAYVATVLLRWRMWQELLPPLAVTPPWSPPGSATAVNGTATSEVCFACGPDNCLPGGTAVVLRDSWLRVLSDLLCGVLCSVSADTRCIIWQTATPKH